MARSSTTFTAGNTAGKGRPKGKTHVELVIAGFVRPNKDFHETEVRERFRIVNERYNWYQVVLSQEGFPDMLLRDVDGNLIRAEVETKSRHFVQHRHDIESCDLIICWEHNWTECPMPVLVMSVEWHNYQQMKNVKPFMQAPGPLK